MTERPAPRVPATFPSSLPVPIAFIGEAPGEEEVEKGAPLVGPSGRVFNAMLRTAGIDRSQHLITNVFDQKAPGNDVGEWIKDPVRWEEAMARLAEELDRAKPTVAVPLGGTAFLAMTGRGNISGYRGTVLPATEVRPGLKLVPTLHPAFVLRQWQMYSVVIGDFVKAAAEAERGPEIVRPKRRLLLDPTVEEVEAYAEACKRTDLLSVDIETGWGQITMVALAPSAEEAMCIPFLDMRTPTRSYWKTAAEEARAWRALKGVLEHPVPKLGQNFTYDAMWLLEKAGIRTKGYGDDTRLMHKTLYAELPASLEFLGSAYGQQGAWKQMASWRKDTKRDD